MRENVKKKSVIHKCLRLVVLAGVFVVAGIPVQGMGALTVEAAATTINSTSFPDANFRAYVTEKFDTDGNGVLSDAEKNAVRTISVSFESIASLTGVEYFKNLQILKCGTNQINSLDVSKNTVLTYLDCYDNQISNLDVSKNTALTHLDCFDNRISSIDVSKNIALTYLSCSSNQISSLDVSKNTALIELDCGYNQISSLDVSKNTALTELYCDGNQISSLDVNKNIMLRTFSCSSNRISSLDVSKNSALTKLDCESNQISSLDVNKNLILTYLNCGNNYQISSLDVSKNTALTDLRCNYTQISSLDISKNTMLTHLDCYDNKISSLDVSKSTALTWLQCTGNQISNLDVNKNTELTFLNCGNNQISSLDVSKNTALTKLYCYDNQISSLDVSKNTALTELYCYDNQIGSLDVSKNTVLTDLRCYNNEFSNGRDSFDTVGLKGFDLSRVSNWTNASIFGTVVTAVDVTCPVTYLYDCGNNYSETFTFTPTRATYTIAFNANGGSCSTISKSVTYKGTYGALPTPTRTGYSFSGWYTSVSGGSQVMNRTTVSITSNQTLYAHWIANAYTVNFNSSGGSCDTQSKNVTYGCTYGTLPTPTRKGYIFSGWYTEPSGGNQVTGSTTMLTAENNTLFAHWIKNEESQTNPETNQQPEQPENIGGGQQVQKPSNPGSTEKRDNKLKTPAKQNNKKCVEKLNISLKSATGVTKADQYMVLGKTKVSKKKLVLKLKTSGVKIKTYKSSNKKVATVSKKGLVKLKKIGMTTITVTATVRATGKKISKKYTLMVNPDKTILESAQSKATGKITIKWKQNSSGDGYEIYRSLSRNFKDVNDRTYKIPDSKKTVATLEDLIPGAKYYIKVRSYKLVSGKPYYGAWSKVKTVKIK